MAANKATVSLPPGMSVEEFNKAFASFQKGRVATAARDKIVRAATKKLIDAHKAEYEKYVKDATPA